jgi:putative SOS response-associated peptidase YedK
VAHAQTGKRVVDGFEWGLVPFWAKEKMGAKMINARSETVSEKPAFRSAFAKRRCIIPSDGFYEWDKAGGTRDPYHFRRKDGALWGFAGLWETWRDPNNSDAEELYTCTILTTEANRTVGKVHERMPVIFGREEDEALWLAGDAPLPELQSLFRPYPDDLMEAVLVSRRVNRPVIDDPELIALATVNSA